MNVFDILVFCCVVFSGVWVADTFGIFWAVIWGLALFLVEMWHKQWRRDREN